MNEKTKVIVEEKFIFNNDILPEKLSHASGIFKNKHYKGVFIPKLSVEVKEGIQSNITRVVPVIICSDHTHHEITKPFCDSFNCDFTVQLEQKSRWTLGSVENFLLHSGNLSKAYEHDSLIEIFDQVKTLYEKLLCMQSGYYSLHALWDIGTYFFDCFEAYPYIELNALKGCGKSKLMELSSDLTFNGTMILGFTTATVFRIIENNRPTLYLDEAEGLFRTTNGKSVESSDIVEILNAGYCKSKGVVPRCELVNGKYVIRYFNVYCPKMLASINGLKGALKDRAITNYMTKPKKNDKRGSLDVSAFKEEIIQTRDHLYETSLSIFSLVHYNYINFSSAGTLENRDLQIWKPILCLAKMVSDDIYNEMLSLATVNSSRKDVLYEEGSWEHSILSVVYSLFKFEDEVEEIIVKNVVSILHSSISTKISSRYVGKFLTTIGLSNYKKRLGSGTLYRFSKKNFLDVLHRQEIPTPTTLTTLTKNIDGIQEEFVH